MTEYKYCPEHEKIKSSVSWLRYIILTILLVLVLKIGLDMKINLEMQKTRFGYVKIAQFQEYKDKDLEFKQKVYERLSRIEAILEEHRGR